MDKSLKAILSANLVSHEVQSILECFGIEDVREINAEKLKKIETLMNITKNPNFSFTPQDQALLLSLSSQAAEEDR